MLHLSPRERLWLPAWTLIGDGTLNKKEHKIFPYLKGTVLDRSIRQPWMMRKNKNMMTRKPSVGNVDDGHLNWPLAQCKTRGLLTTQCRTIHRKPREIPGKYYSHVIACLSPWFIWHFIPKAAINTQNMPTKIIGTSVICETC